MQEKFRETLGSLSPELSFLFIIVKGITVSDLNHHSLPWSFNKHTAGALPATQVTTDRSRFLVVYNTIHIILFRVILGAQMLRKLFAQRKQLIQYMNFLHAQIMMMFVYPIYEVLFRFVEGSNFQLPVILLLPLMVVVIKNIVLRCTKHVEDMTPELVIFTVDFFNAIYVATCMQSATSALAISAIIMTDLSQTMIMLYGLHHRTNGILARLQAVIPGVGNLNNLLAASCCLCRNTEVLGQPTRSGINTFSHFPHRLPTADNILLKKLNGASKSRGVVSPPTVADIPSRENTRKSSALCIICTRKRSKEIHPSTPSNGDAEGTRVPVDSEPLRFLSYSLETFFTIECLVVTS
ncbi:hypothetical protein PHYSODRAFT_335464 [Phytophthora sojae]|uniref:Uncharacterized protein n=1 Tax=Phytophthora sojae (strain P6497) TaxID=1094619 RepID=G4ZVA0_PHYSP|nr:hypothetical protein PHYSODRAFT_335464 [Phytophthora sojae]EGZ13724.1 hypothetical protein PHYSODRAFT_335464 [Phytophthora sojae]|eukprot:XP_009531153.1 hypothetical protein PHYSODRAFT_335464 [Phytophthora sojae]